jgi:hypothetical protein
MSITKAIPENPTFSIHPGYSLVTAKRVRSGGKHHIADIEEYLDNNPDVNFIVYRTYSCSDYCRKYKDSFERLTVPQIDPNILARIRAYFFSLRETGEAAIALSEHITIVSTELQNASENLESMYPDHLQEWDSAEHFQAPYLQLYHCRDILADHSV